MDNDNTPQKPSEVDAVPNAKKPIVEPAMGPGPSETEAQPDGPKSDDAAVNDQGVDNGSA